MADKHFVILTRPNCGWCEKAKNVIKSHGDTYKEFDILEYSHLRDFMIANDQTTVPQIYRTGGWIGGFTELQHYYKDPYDDIDY